MTFKLISNVFTQIRHRLDGISFDRELNARQVMMFKKIIEFLSQGIKVLLKLKCLRSFRCNF